jgi:hypothetical protein
VLGGEGIEREQRLEVVDDLATALGRFAPISQLNAPAARVEFRSSAARISASILRAVGWADFGRVAGR